MKFLEMASLFSLIHLSSPQQDPNLKLQDTSNLYFEINDDEQKGKRLDIQSPSLVNTRQRKSTQDLDCQSVEYDIEYALFWTEKLEAYKSKSAQSDMQHATNKQHSSALKQSLKLLKNGCKVVEDGDQNRYSFVNYIQRQLYGNFEKTA